jgi:dipeptidyl aminopeptidase/acylaminoacyl peptidase
MRAHVLNILHMLIFLHVSPSSSHRLPIPPYPMHRNLPPRRFLVWAALLFVALAARPAAAQGRAFTVDDLLRRERIGGIAASPDGRMLALVVRRGMDGETAARPEMAGYDHADLWMVPLPAGEPRRITGGAGGVLLPAWSPDGRRVAFFSTEGGDNLRAYAWDREGGRIRRLSERGIDFAASGRMTWVDERRVLLALLPQGEQPDLFRQQSQTRDTARVAWARQEAGREPTASVLESGAPQPQLAPGLLTLVDVASGAARTVTEGRFVQVSVAPGARYAAVVAETGWTPPGARLADEGMVSARFGIVPLDGGGVLWIDALSDIRGSVLPLAWAPMGDRLAVIAAPARGEGAAALYVVSAADGVPMPVAGGQVAPDEVRWSREGRLLVRGRAPGAQRAEWWAVSVDGAAPPVAITRGLPALPPQLWGAPCEGRMLALAGGELWSVGVDGGEPRNLTAGFTPQLGAAAIPVASRRPAEEPIVFHAPSGLVRVQPRGCEVEVTPVGAAPERATLAAYAPETGQAVFTADRPDGSWLWTGDAAAVRRDERMRLNRHFAEVRAARRTLVPYRGGDGDTLTAQIVYPAGYVAGRRYPTVAWVYPNTGQPEIADTLAFAPGNFLWWQPELLAARGYAVVIPTFSLPPKEQPRDMYFEVAKDVLLAVDAAVQAGVVDPERVGVFGESFGGWAVYALITQTDRFRAAAATLAPSNLLGRYGVFDARDRYSTRLREYDWPASLEGEYYYNFHQPPWVDRARYERNSPLLYLERVNTPVLIAQGDMDGVPLTEGEQVFTHLYRMGKRARFVRYWGEAHDFGSPANIRHLWSEVGAWFDAHLRDAPAR